MTDPYLTKIQQGLSAKERLAQIVEHGMCIGCGLCQSVAGKDTINMTVDHEGYLVPTVVGDLSQGVMDQITKVCPGTRLEGHSPEGVDDYEDSSWGTWQRMVLAYATDPEVRYLGSTGGLATALGLFLLNSGTVQYVLHTRASDRYPTFGERTVSTTAEDILNASGSRYGPTATLLDLDEILAAEKVFAFVGKPCDVSALNNLSKLDPRVDAYCKFKIAIVCGGFMTPRAMSAFLSDHSIDYGELKSFRYRGLGCPGPTRLETKSGRTIEKTYTEFWGEDDSSWEIPFRCKVCPDAIGDAADIAISDTWIGGSPDPATEQTDPGTNAAIMRTGAGVKLMNDAHEAGYVSIERSIGPRDMDCYQPHQVKKKQSVWARFVGLRSCCQVVPSTRNLRIKRLARANSLADNLGEARGTRLRVRRTRTSRSK